MGPAFYLLLTIILFGEDIIRFFVGLFSLVNSDSKGFLPERRRFVSQIALGVAAIPFASFLYGITVGKYNFKVIKQTLKQWQAKGHSIPRHF